MSLGDMDQDDHTVMIMHTIYCEYAPTAITLGIYPVTPQTPKGPKHERDVSSTCKFFFFDNSIHIIIIECQRQGLS